MGVPKRTPEELERSWLTAYEMKRDGMSLREIAAELKGPPHFCGGYSTAKRWVESGLAVVAAKGDPLRKRHARREMAIDACDAGRVELAQDVKAGLIDREAYHRLRLAYIKHAVDFAGAQAPRELPKVRRPDGSKTPATPGELLDSLAAMQPELDALIDDMLPDERNNR